jgi:hypothetical protein
MNFQNPRVDDCAGDHPAGFERDRIGDAAVALDDDGGLAGAHRH